MNLGVDGMKMIITEISGNTAVGLREDGSFVRLNRHGYAVGQTVEIKHSATVIRLAAACAAAFMLLSTAAAAIRLPYSYVTLDINPSVKYTLNIFNRVLAVSAVNEDARVIVDAVEESRSSYITLDDAIEMTIEQCKAEGYIGKEEEDYVVLSVTSRSEFKTESLSVQLGGLEYDEGHISAKIVPTTLLHLREAEQLGTTPGKLNIIGKMQEETGDTQSADHWINVPVRDIIWATEHKNQGKGSSSTKTVPAEIDSEDSGTKKNENSSSEKEEDSDKSIMQEHANSGRTDAGTVPGKEWKGPLADNQVNPSAPSEDERAHGQSPQEQTNDDRGELSVGTLNGTCNDPKQIEQAISALDEPDRELLRPYIEAYEAALAAQMAAENMQETEELSSSYRDAVSNALAALCEAAEHSGIPFDTSAQDGSGQRQQGDAPQQEHSKEGPNRS